MEEFAKCGVYSSRREDRLFFVRRHSYAILLRLFKSP
jgi:hypothetical protein